MRYLIVFSLLLLSCQSPNPSGSGSVLVESHHPNEVPLKHAFFTVSYNPTHKLPNWVSYKLDFNRVSTKSGARRDKFYADPMVMALKLPYAKPGDYEGAIYDRGHMAPSEDFVWSQTAK